MPKKKIDLTGKRFGRLVVIEEAESSEYLHPVTKQIYKISRLLCKCDCGKEKIIPRNDLVVGDTKSCSCLEKENRNRINENFIKNKIWNHKNTVLFHERDRIVEGTKITTLRPNRIQSNNKSGVRGVAWDKARNKWRAEIAFKGKDIYLGRFDNKQDAINARKEAEDKYFKPILDKYDKS